MVDMDSMKAQLSKYILKQRLNGGEFLTKLRNWLIEKMLEKGFSTE